MKSAYQYYQEKDRKRAFKRGVVVGVVCGVIVWFAVAGVVSLAKGTSQCIQNYQDSNC